MSRLNDSMEKFCTQITYSDLMKIWKIKRHSIVSYYVYKVTILFFFDTSKY